MAIGHAQAGALAAVGCLVARQILPDFARTQHTSHGTAMHAVALFYSVLLGEVRMRIANRQQGVQRSCSTPDFVGLNRSEVSTNFSCFS